MLVCFIIVRCLHRIKLSEWCKWRIQRPLHDISHAFSPSILFRVIFPSLGRAPLVVRRVGLAAILSWLTNCPTAGAAALFALHIFLYWPPHGLFTNTAPPFKAFTAFRRPSQPLSPVCSLHAWHVHICVYVHMCNSISSRIFVKTILGCGVLCPYRPSSLQTAPLGRPSIAVTAYLRPLAPPPMSCPSR
jgi:hypothetical protein